MSESFCYLAKALSASVVLLDGAFRGLRKISSLGSIIQVCAAPWTEFERIRETVPLTYMAYILEGSRVYVGHGHGTRQIGDRLKPEDRATLDQAFVLYASDPRFDKPLAAYLESRLIDTCHELGMPLINYTRPFGCGGLQRTEEFERLVTDALFLLYLAGFHRCEEARTRGEIPQNRLIATAVLDDIVLMEPDDFVVAPGVSLQRIEWDGLQATGFAADDRFFVLPGADWSYENRRGLSEGNIRRRRALVAKGAVDPIAGSTKRGRLRPGLSCKSAAGAAAVVSGKPLRAAAWKIPTEHTTAS